MSRQNQSLTVQVVLVTNIVYFVGLPAAGAPADQGAVVVSHDKSLTQNEFFEINALRSRRSGVRATISARKPAVSLVSLPPTALLT